MKFLKERVKALLLGLMASQLILAGCSLHLLGVPEWKGKPYTELMDYVCKQSPYDDCSDVGLPEVKLMPRAEIFDSWLKLAKDDGYYDKWVEFNGQDATDRYLAKAKEGMTAYYDMKDQIFYISNDVEDICNLEGQLVYAFTMYLLEEKEGKIENADNDPFAMMTLDARRRVGRMNRIFYNDEFCKETTDAGSGKKAQ